MCSVFSHFCPSSQSTVLKLVWLCALFGSIPDINQSFVSCLPCWSVSSPKLLGLSFIVYCFSLLKLNSQFSDIEEKYWFGFWSSLLVTTVFYFDSMALSGYLKVATRPLIAPRVHVLSYTNIWSQVYAGASAHVHVCLCVCLCVFLCLCLGFRRRQRKTERETEIFSSLTNSEIKI